jgi:hypothetical protein
MAHPLSAGHRAAEDGRRVGAVTLVEIAVIVRSSEVAQLVGATSNDCEYVVDDT